MDTPLKVLHHLRGNPDMMATVLGLLLTEERVAMPWVDSHRHTLAIEQGKPFAFTNGAMAQRLDPRGNVLARIYREGDRWDSTCRLTSGPFAYRVVAPSVSGGGDAEGVGLDFDEVLTKVDWTLGKRAFMLIDLYTNGHLTVRPSLLS